MNEDAMNTVLIVDDEAQILKLLSRIIGLEGYHVATASDCKSALKQISREAPRVVLCDVFLPDGNGVDLVSEIKKKSPDTEIILLTAHGNIADGVQAIKNGAFDYITKGDDNNKIIPLLARAMEKTCMNAAMRNVEATPDSRYSFDSIIGRSASIKQSEALARKVAATAVAVLLTGETGTGKEVFAQAIHHASGRAKNRFVAVNCSALSHELLESELFGYKAGAFTGAMKDKKGLFEEADGGTIFLDEIGEMPVDLQVKLLRVLENGEYMKVGDTKPVRADVRLIAATNRNLKEEIAGGRFREDLFYRISIFQIHLPPLRERTGDIPLLTHYFIDKFSGKQPNSVCTATPAYMDILAKQPWKGNVRELQNVIERSLIVREGDTLDVQDLPLELQHTRHAVAETDELAGLELSEVEKHHIVRILEYTHGNKAEAARILKIGLTTLYRKIDEYHISFDILPSLPKH
jgi:Response regulator containing CheY-like receiver, AAA-type ATPase, and DNA-binding domains